MRSRRVACVLLTVLLSGGALARHSLGEDAKPATVPGDTPPARPGNGMLAGLMLQRVTHALSELKLTDEQKPKVDAVMRKTQEEFKALREEPAGAEPGERVKRIGQVVSNMRSQLQGILTEDQLKELRTKLQPTGGAGGQQGVIDRLHEAMSQLDLSEDQKKQVESAVRKTRDDIEKARQDSGGSPDKMQEKMQAIREGTMRRLADILTPEQSEKLRALLSVRTTRPS